MRTRRIINFGGQNRVVWFGSYGMKSDGNAMFVNPENVHDNFSEEKQMVVDSLIQYLSVIKGELWYNVYYGVPLPEKLSKIEMDMELGEIIIEHPYVNEITSFESRMIGLNYECTFTVDTTFGEVEVSI